MNTLEHHVPIPSTCWTCPTCLNTKFMVPCWMNTSYNWNISMTIYPFSQSQYKTTLLQGSTPNVPSRHTLWILLPWFSLSIAWSSLAQYIQGWHCHTHSMMLKAYQRSWMHGQCVSHVVSILWPSLNCHWTTTPAIQLYPNCIHEIAWYGSITRLVLTELVSNLLSSTK